MRISDWSSDVCSSDLKPPRTGPRLTAAPNRISSASWTVRLALIQKKPSVCWVITASLASRSKQAEGVSSPTGGDRGGQVDHPSGRSEEHTSELQSLMRISYAVFCLKKKKKHRIN